MGVHVVARILAAVVVAAIAVACTDNARDEQSAACKEVTATADSILARPLPTTTSTTSFPTTSRATIEDEFSDLADSFARSDRLRADWANQQATSAATTQHKFRQLEELAILAEQNPNCFPPDQRALIERHYREAQRARQAAGQ